MRLLYAIVLATTVFMAGCAATVSREAATPGVTPAAPQAATRVLLEVTGAGGIGRGEDWNALLEEWQTSMKAATSSKGAQFTLLSPGAALPPGPAVLVKMKVNDFRYVSQAKRYALGILSGNAFLDLDVAYIELPQFKTISTRKFQTSSSAWQGVFSAMTPKQVEAVSNEIVTEITGR